MKGRLSGKGGRCNPSLSVCETTPQVAGKMPGPHRTGHATLITKDEGR